jgi:hypothetical protein
MLKMLMVLGSNYGLIKNCVTLARTKSAGAPRFSCWSWNHKVQVIVLAILVSSFNLSAVSLCDETKSEAVPDLGDGNETSRSITVYT